MNRHWLALLTLTFFLGACDQSTVSNADAAPPTTNLRNVSVEEVALLIAQNPSVVVLDVRTPGEFAQGHIQGAQNLDFHSADFDERLAALDPDTSYVLTCQSGVRSRRTLKKMKQRGFSDVAHLKSGMAGWRKADRPEVTE
ncbi:MAG: rhodanese-like domain-containing protein [Gammaproteobacteria bacterium]